MFGLRVLGTFVILAIVASSAHFNHFSLNSSNQTYHHELYLQGPRLNAKDARENVQGPQFTTGNQIAIVAIHATISALPDVHVQIWLVIQGQDPLFHVNSGSLGTANSDLSGLNIIVNPNTPIILYWWADNLSDSQRDFHASITIFYQTS